MVPNKNSYCLDTVIWLPAVCICEPLILPAQRIEFSGSKLETTSISSIVDRMAYRAKFKYLFFLWNHWTLVENLLNRRTTIFANCSIINCWCLLVPEFLKISEKFFKCAQEFRNTNTRLSLPRTIHPNSTELFPSVPLIGESNKQTAP